MRVAFHENDGNHEDDEGNSDSYAHGVECWISGNHSNHGNDENHRNPECKPRVPQQWVLTLTCPTMAQENDKQKTSFGSSQEGGSKRVALADVSCTESRNKGIFRCSPGTKNGTRVHLNVPRYQRGDVHQNHRLSKPPFVSDTLC